MYAHYCAQVKPSLSEDSVSIPLLQCRREDLALKQDVQLLLDMLGVDVSELCCLDDLAPAALSLVGKLSVVLVDHNAPTGRSSVLLVIFQGTFMWYSKCLVWNPIEPIDHT